MEIIKDGFPGGYIEIGNLEELIQEGSNPHGGKI